MTTLCLNESFVTTIDSWPSTDEGLTLFQSVDVSAFRPQGVELPRPLDANDFLDIDQAVAELDADPAMATVMADARVWAGEVLFDAPVDSLRALRLSRGFSQKVFASAMQTNQAVVSRWENGKLDIRTSTLHRMATVLGVEPEKVFLAACKGSDGTTV